MARARRRSLAAVLVTSALLVAPAAAAAKSFRFEVRPTRIAARTGGVLTVTLRPRTGRELFGYWSRLEQRTSTGWRAIGVLTMCELPCADSTLQPLDSAVNTSAIPLYGVDPVITHERIPAGLPPGIYRIVRFAESTGTGAGAVASNTFSVR